MLEFGVSNQIDVVEQRHPTVTYHKKFIRNASFVRTKI